MLSLRSFKYSGLDFDENTDEWRGGRRGRFAASRTLLHAVLQTNRRRERREGVWRGGGGGGDSQIAHRIDLTCEKRKSLIQACDDVLEDICTGYIAICLDEQIAGGCEVTVKPGETAAASSIEGVDAAMGCIKDGVFGCILAD
jgi:hypothetical protein